MTTSTDGETDIRDGNTSDADAVDSDDIQTSQPGPSTSCTSLEKNSSNSLPIILLVLFAAFILRRKVV